MSDSAKQERIRERAYLLWQADGGPHGRAEEYWVRAEAMETASPSEPESAMEPLDEPPTVPAVSKATPAVVEPVAVAPAAVPKPARRTGKAATTKARS